MKKIICTFLCLLFSMNNIVFASHNISASLSSITKEVYDQKTVSKHYNVYNLKITNNNEKPLLLTTQTEFLFTLDDGSVVKSENRRAQYRKVRKRDIGRYYWLALPGSIISSAVTGFTLFLGAPIGFAIYVGMYAPTDKAVRTNVKISQDVFNQNVLPIRMEKGKTYNTTVYIPKKLNVKNVTISNVSFDLKDKFDLVMDVEEL